MLTLVMLMSLFSHEAYAQSDVDFDNASRQEVFDDRISALYGLLSDAYNGGQLSVRGVTVQQCSLAWTLIRSSECVHPLQPVTTTYSIGLNGIRFLPRPDEWAASTIEIASGISSGRTMMLEVDIQHDVLPNLDFSTINAIGEVYFILSTYCGQESRVRIGLSTMPVLVRGAKADEFEQIVYELSQENQCR